MAAGALEDDEILLRIDFIDQEPVGSDMAFPAALPGTGELWSLNLGARRSPARMLTITAFSSGRSCPPSATHLVGRASLPTAFSEKIPPKIDNSSELSVIHYQLSTIH